MKNYIYKELIKIEKKGGRLSNTGNNVCFQLLREKTEARIPPNFQAKLNSLFYQAFKFIFKNGTGVIEKTYNKEKNKEDYIVNNYAFETLANKRAIKRLSGGARKKQLTNLGIATSEGSFLGLLGIGLPDIPIFIGVLLKSIYETAMSYGFSYDNDTEKYYILLLIEAALASGAKKRRLNTVIDKTAAEIDNNTSPNWDMESQMKQTAAALTNDLLVMKFIQGLPLVGVVGGAGNLDYCHKITDYAKLKYKKRYLLKKLSQ